MVKNFKNILNNISKQPNQTVDFKAFNTVVTVTSNPDKIQELYSNKDLCRSELSKRILNHIGAVDGWVSQDDEKARIKRQIYKTHLNSKVYESLSKNISENICLKFNQLINSNIDLDSHSILVSIVIQSFLDHFLQVDMSKDSREFLKDMKMFQNDPGFSTSISKLFFLNYSKFLPKVFKDTFSFDLKKRDVNLKLFTDHLYYDCSGKNGSLYNSLKQSEEGDMLTKEDVIGELKMILINANSMANSLMWSLYAISKNKQYSLKITQDSDYSRWAFMEVLRMYPPFHMLSYESKNQSKCPMRFLSPKKTEFISVLGTHMSSINWDDPEVFDPERFSKGLSNIKKGSYIPFGGGERACPGSGLAMVIGPNVMQTICSKYDIFAIKDPVVKRRVELLPAGGTILFKLNNK